MTTVHLTDKTNNKKKTQREKHVQLKVQEVAEKQLVGQKRKFQHKKDNVFPRLMTYATAMWFISCAKKGRSKKRTEKETTATFAIHTKKNTHQNKQCKKAVQFERNDLEDNTLWVSARVNTKVHAFVHQRPAPPAAFPLAPRALDRARSIAKVWFVELRSGSLNEWVMNKINDKTATGTGGGKTNKKKQKEQVK
jgi:hypothetical protein